MQSPRLARLSVVQMISPPPEVNIPRLSLSYSEYPRFLYA